MTSSPEPPPRPVGTTRARHRTSGSGGRAPSHSGGPGRTGGPRTLVRRPPARYEPYLDGLFTYCLSVLCDHDTATDALGQALAVAERHAGRCPATDPDRRAWLYALTRWACLRELAERRSRRAGAHAGRPAGEPPKAPVSERVTEERRDELARLAWPEAAGTTSAQREALELAVRHGLGAPQVAAVLGLETAAARELLSAAACEVERTRAALAVVDTGGCPAVARLTGDHRLLLSAALRLELVRHVDDCPRCRRAAERTGAGGPWPGSSVTPARLPLVGAPGPAVYTAMAHLPRTRTGGPRFGRGGFPMDPRDQAARRDRMRARAVTTTVVATVVAAPVLAIWAAYRGAPETGEGPGSTAVSTDDTGTAGSADDRDGRHGGPDAEDTTTRTGSPSPGSGMAVEVVSGGDAAGDRSGRGRLSVAAEPAGAFTALTLTASGDSPVRWSLWTDAPWLYASQTSGTLRPGESVRVFITVDRDREPTGRWSGRVGIEPAGAVVAISGRGAARPSPHHPRPTAEPTRPPHTPEPTDPGPTDPGPTDPGPTDPGPTDPGPTDPGPTDPGPTEPGPGGDSDPPGGPGGDTGSPTQASPATPTPGLS
ncbi:hypothetical protein NX801_29370 [Streptomyces sp. LP05-1]|uniref:BACON domain-containing protein n=1 Tax=Streptomyces pyxinae TaxID=2970734 RepID=A0ABT2CQF8_9ACTN|nr:hypothetical protein [Streptomyces sp. LP05-1]MCS0639674.1 hypothetical protein [Streptomyces sp. LP05-1]